MIKSNASCCLMIQRCAVVAPLPNPFNKLSREFNQLQKQFIFYMNCIHPLSKMGRFYFFYTLRSTFVDSKK